MNIRIRLYMGCLRYSIKFISNKNLLLQKSLWLIEKKGFTYKAPTIQPIE